VTTFVEGGGPSTEISSWIARHLAGFLIGLSISILAGRIFLPFQFERFKNTMDFLLRSPRMRFLGLLFLAVALLGGCALPPPPIAVPASTSAPAVSVAPTTNLTDGCVKNYDAGVDYFPQKATIAESSGWTVEYFNNYKVVSVLNPWRGATEGFQYVLVQCGTPAPGGYPDAQVIEVPIKTIITMSTTQLPQLLKLNRLDTLRGVDSFGFINTPEVRALIDAGKLAEVGGGGQVNVEVVVDTNADIVMSYGVGNPDTDAHPKLLEAGVKVAMNAGYMEMSPLGRAEWIKYMGLFFNEEATASASYDEMAARYNETAALARSVTDKPTVFLGAAWKGTWTQAGGHSYMARYLADAGADYLWANDDSTGGIPLDFETVFERAQAADFWLNTSSWHSLADGQAADERYGEFAAFQNGQVFNNNARSNENGGNDYWEGGLANPDVVLADLIRILHPELLPDHELVYYHRLDSVQP